MEKTIINESDWNEKFWRHNYKIYVGPFAGPYYVNADNEQEALDYLIDWAKENAPGLVASFNEIDEEEAEEFYCGGNDGLYLTETEIHIEILR